ncbi:hypothetical protein [Streptomyces sp. NPDC096068]|uniref:hypothetical protein n=1 Tax=Streptomyces sp. NPDC096068 TaxID=3155424 RepID=UPI00331DB81B
MRRGFGERSGLPRALGPLPLAPLVPEYDELMSRQMAAGVDHFGEALVGSGESLSFVDGLFLCAGSRRRHVDAARLRALAAADPSRAPLLELLADVQERDPALLRRVLLHQLIPLLQGGGSRASLAGVEPSETAVLAQAVRTVPVLDARQRKAADALGRLWRQRRLRAVGRALDTLGTTAVQADPALTTLAARLALRLDRCDRSLAAARAARDPHTAGRHYLDALGTAADDDTATRGLIMLERPRPREDALLSVRLTGDRVLLSWPVPDGAGSGGTGSGGTGRRLVRLTRGTDRPAIVPLSAPGPGSRETAVDPDPLRGTLVRYAVFPTRDGVPDTLPLVSRPLLIAPDVEDLAVTDGPARLTVRWTRPPRTGRVTVTLHAGTASAPPGDVVARHGADARTDTHAFTGLAPGPYSVRVVCHHPSPRGEDVESAGVRASATVHPWPEALASLTAEADPEGGVRFTGRGPAGTEVRLVAWADPAGTPPPGTGLRTDALPAPLPWAAYGTDRPVEPPSAFSGLVAGVTVLGERAVVGPSVRLDVPAPVTGLRALRESDGHVRLVFDWPADAGSVEASWERRGVRERVRVSRSRFLREGLRLPVGPSAARIDVRAASRHEPTAGAPETGAPEAGASGPGASRPGASGSGVSGPGASGPGASGPGAGAGAGAGAASRTVVVRRAPASVVLPGDVVVSYRLVVRRRGLTRKVVSAGVEVTVAGADPGCPLPDFVLVRRGGDTASARPRHRDDGDVLVRLTGADLAASPHTTRELSPGLLRPPYALRAFLAGEHAASARLEEPALSTLVVR